MLQSSTYFKEKLYQSEFKSNQILVSFDVNSLFPNVPLNETINLIATKIYSISVDEALKPPTKTKIFAKLLKLPTQGMFIYKGKVFQQIDGVTMGLPLCHTSANFLLANLKTRLLQQILHCSPKLFD